MLDYIRRNAGSWFLKIILGAVVLVFVFWGIGTYRANRLAVMATVNGEKILVRDYEIAYQNTLDQYRRMFNGELPEGFIKKINLKKRVLDQLIDQILIEQAAHNLGLIVTKEEIRQAILHIPAFQLGGKFSLRLYKQILANANLTPEQFESQVRESLLENKLKTLLLSSLSVPEDEILDFYKYKNQQIDLKYVVFHPQDFIKKVKPTLKELKNWYNSHSKDYMTAPQIKIAYLLFPIKDFEKQVKITKKDIEEYYKSHLSQYTTPEKRRVRHILLKIPPNASLKQLNKIYEKANKIISELKKGASFTELAKKYSQDKLTASKGGDLGFVERGQTVPTFDKLVFSLKPGEIGGPVRTRFGLHIVEVTKIIPKKVTPLSKVKDEIEKILKIKRAEGLAFKAAQNAYDQILQLGSLKAYEKRNNVTLKRTNFFDKQNPPSFLIGDSEAIRQLFALGQGELSSLLKVRGGVLIAQVIAKRAPYVPAFKDVKDKVRQDVIETDAFNLCKEEAQKLLKLAQKEGLEKAAKTFKVKVKETGYFKRSDLTANGTLPPKVVEIGLELSQQTPMVSHIIIDQTGIYILSFVGQKPADMKDYKKEKDIIKKAILQDKQLEVFNSWLNIQRAKAKINIIQQP